MTVPTVRRHTMGPHWPAHEDTMAHASAILQEEMTNQFWQGVAASRAPRLLSWITRKITREDRP